MSENLTKFLVDLASDPERMNRFAANPSAELDGTALSTGEKEVLLARDPARLRRALGASPVDHMTKATNGHGHGGKNGGKDDDDKDNGGKNRGGKKASRKRTSRKRTSRKKTSRMKSSRKK